jgi:hypothetical protein
LSGPLSWEASRNSARNTLGLTGASADLTEVVKSAGTVILKDHGDQSGTLRPDAGRAQLP